MKTAGKGIDFRFKLFMGFLASSVIPTVIMWVIFMLMTDSFAVMLSGSLDQKSAQVFMNEAQIMVWKMALINMAVLLVLIGIAVLLASRFMKNIASPIVEMAEAVSEYKEGDNLRLPAYSSDELGALAKRFVTMADTISNLKSNLSLFQKRMDSVSETIEEKNLSDEEKNIREANGLKNALQGLTELNKNTDELLSLVRHELKTPLTSIIASTEALMSDLPFTPEKKESIISIIQDEAQRLTRLINEMMNPENTKIDKIRLKKQPIDTAAFVRHVVLANQPLADAKKITMQMTAFPDDERLKSVPADRDRLTQLLTNILDNAIKFTPENGLIIVGIDIVPEQSGEKSADFIRISVKDSGPGIDPAMQEKVFEKFQQLKSVSPQPEGMGLGMAVAKWIALAHGGRIWFESGQGGGTTFYFTLPPANEQQPGA